MPGISLCSEFSSAALFVLVLLIFTLRHKVICGETKAPDKFLDH